MKKSLKFRDLIRDFVHFWLNSSALEARKNFSRGQNCMYMVSRTFSAIKAFKRTYFYVRVTHRSKTFRWFLIFSMQKATPRQLFEYDFSEWRSKYPTSLVMAIRSMCNCEWCISNFFGQYASQKLLPNQILSYFDVISYCEKKLGTHVSNFFDGVYR